MAEVLDRPQTKDFDDLTVGTAGTYTRTVTERDIELFAEVTGDANPVHLDEDYAKGTMFKGRIAHGMLGAGFISTVLGTEMPGPGCIYLSQNLKFKAPVRIGDSVTATVTVTERNDEKRRLVMSTVCTVGDTVVIDGEAVVMLPAAS